MKCINCSSPALPSTQQLCQTCQTLYDLGMISLPTPNPNLLKDEDFGYIIDPVNEQGLIDTIINSQAAPTLSINSETISEPASIPLEPTFEQRFVNTLETMEQSTESNHSKIDISTLFLASGSIKEEPVNLEKFLDIVDNQDKREIEIATSSVIINRPKFLIEMDGPLTEEDKYQIQHLAALDAQEQNSIMSVYKMIDAQCDNEGLGSAERYHRKEDYLSEMIASFKKKQAEYRQLEMTHVRKRNKLRYEETEKLTPEEREDFARRARSNNPDAIRKKELKAAEKKELKVSDFLMKTAMRRVKLGVSKNIEEALEFVTKELGE